MAEANTATSSSHRHMNEGNSNEINAAFAKAVELRAIHAALLHGTSPATLRRLPPRSLSSRDCPVFTPTYEDDERPNFQFHNYYGDHQEKRSVTTFQTSPAAEVLDSRRRRNSLGDFKSVSLKLGFSDADSIANHNSCKHSNIVMPLTDSHVAVHSQHKSKKMIFSRLFSGLRKKAKGKNLSSPIGMESEGFSRVIMDFGAVSVEALRKELVEANRERDVALAEVEKMKYSFGDLRKKLDNLEGYCEELKRALRQGPRQQPLSKSGKLADCGGGDADAMPVCKEVMAEGFLQIVSEARLLVKHFCETLIGQIDETDDQLIDNLDALLQPYKLSLLSSKYSKAVLYHLEAIVNETLHQDFENCVFQRNGSSKLLDPQQDREAQFSSFVALRNLSWNEVLRKGTKYYSEDFSKFCDQKMSSIISILNWIKPWSEQLLESFFVAAKCVWLLHLLAFSCYPPLTILRVEENRPFDHHYMDDILTDKQRAQMGTSRVKVMVTPGFHVQDKILRCKVLCRYKPLK